MDTKKIETVLTTVTIDSKVDGGKIDVVVGESAKMDVVKAVNYIQSGKAEIEAGVTEVLNQVDDHVAEKTAEFDLNASNKTGDFNDNYVEKKALIDAEVAVAEGYSAEAKQWAIGEPTEPSEGSAKYWAEQASRTLPNDGQLDIQVNGSSVATFTANQSGNTTADITIPTATSELTNDSGFITVSALSGYATESWVTNKGYITGISSSDVITALGYTPYDSSNPAGYITSSALSPYALSSSLSAVATSGAYSDLSGKPIYGAGLSYSSSSLQLLDQNGNNLGSAVTIKSTPDLDGVTIDTNSDDELEAIGVIDNNGNAIKTWTGTLAQYNAIATKDSNTLYNITDDMSVPQTILEALYPVGSLYIGKMSTCPLASLIPNSTWTLVASDKVLQGSGTYTAGTSVSAGLPNITGTLERVVTCTSGGSGTAVSKGTGAFSGTPSTAVNKTAPGSGNWWNDTRDLSFKASNSNSIYGKSTTVQPPAYVVNIWERTA